MPLKRPLPRSGAPASGRDYDQAGRQAAVCVNGPASLRLKGWVAEKPVDARQLVMLKIER